MAAKNREKKEKQNTAYQTPNGPPTAHSPVCTAHSLDAGWYPEYSGYGSSPE